MNWHTAVRYISGVGPVYAKRLENLKWQSLWQLVILPAYKEPLDVVVGSMEAILNSDWPKDRMIVVLALEERAGEHAKNLEKEISAKYADKFARFLVTFQSSGLEGEIPGMGSNISWAARFAKERIVDAG